MPNAISESLYFVFGPYIVGRVPTAQGKQGKWQKVFPVRENTGNLEILPKHRENTGNLVCSSCKLPDFKGKRYFEICRKKISQKMLKLDTSAKSVLCM